MFQLIKDFYNATYLSRYGNFSDSGVTLTWSLTTALFIPGGMIGAFLGGWLADKIGRLIHRSAVLTLWRLLLPYGYSYRASCARPG